MDKLIQLSDGSKTIDLPVYDPILGNPTIDVRSLGKNKYFTYDPGYYATAACESKITFIDGVKGVLLYRGYPIDELAARCTYLDICHLLMHGELPTTQEKTDLKAMTDEAAALLNDIKPMLQGFAQNAHPMGMLQSIIGGLSTHPDHACDHHQPKDRQKAAVRLIALTPMVTAMIYRHSQDKAAILPDPSLSFSENFVYMMFGEPHPVLAHALDKIFILHADHEQNASTATVRMAGSTGTHPFAAISAGISALWGPAHGGANEACLNMLKEIGDESHIEQYIERAKDKDDPFRLMGFGHRVYKSYDPRALVMQQTCHEVLEATQQHDNPLFKLAMKLEKIALEDPYFIEKKLYPNVDFYSGITLSAMGIPTELFTAIFALARTSGWVSHWNEMMSDSNHPLYRPRQLYMGYRQRELPSEF